MSKNKEYKRIVVKAGTSLLTKGSDRLNISVVSDIVSQISGLQAGGYQMVMVTSGAVAVGREVLAGIEKRGGIPERQVLAAVGQGRLMNIYDGEFSKKGTISAQALLSRGDVNDRLRYLNVRNTIIGLIESGVVPIINENDVVAVDELTSEVFGDNDNLSALVANLIDADLLIILGTVKGMYTKDPTIHSDAEIVPVVEKIDESLEAFAGPSSDGMGRGGMVTKIEAAKLATSSGIDVVIASGMEHKPITRLAAGDRIGTLFSATVSKLESRKRWMLSSLRSNLVIRVDPGATKALKEHHRSLLPAGIVVSEGDFGRGDIVSIVDSGGTNIGVGITNYSADDLNKIRKIRSDKIQNVLGYQYGDEAIHKNNLVLVEHS